jgi:hypothetical protein
VVAEDRSLGRTTSKCTHLLMPIRTSTFAALLPARFDLIWSIPATGTLNLGQSGEEAAFFVYASSWRGFASVRATAVQATVHDPNGGSVALLLKDDGICELN